MIIAIFGKTVSVSDMPYLQSLVDKLEGTGSTIFFYQPFYTSLAGVLRFAREPMLFSKHAEIRSEADYLFSIGGDGTFLDSIMLVGDSNIPIIGINMGRLGFLSTLSKEEILPAVDRIFAGEYRIEKRSLLRLETEGNLFGDANFAMNDLTIYKKTPLSMITIRVSINGLFVNTYWADGLIVATPTGSTAYSLSCTGPIITPDAGTFVITPIASHNLTVRPMVIPDTSVITISVDGRGLDAFVGLDSRSLPFDHAFEMTVRKEVFSIHLLRLPGSDFFSTLREKLNWGRDARN
jgi:NAD+ kinase